MNYDTIYIIIVAAVGGIGLWSYLSRLARPRFKLLLKKEKPDPFQTAGMGFSLRQYQLLRWALLGGLALYAVCVSCLQGRLSVFWCCIASAAVLLTSPQFPLSVVPLILKMARHQTEKAVSREVLRAFIQLRTLALMDVKLNGYEVVRTLSRHTTALRPVMAELLKYWHIEVLRQDALEKLACMPRGNELAGLLSKLYTAQPKELLPEIDLCEKRAMEERQTLRERQRGAINDTFFTVATLLFMAVMLDFVYVVMMSNLGIGFNGYAYAPFKLVFMALLSVFLGFMNRTERMLGRCINRIQLQRHTARIDQIMPLSGGNDDCIVIENALLEK